MSQENTVFVDERILDLNYIPDTLLHRDEELRMLNALFDFMIQNPYDISQRAIIIGDVGTGKTALAQRFGLNLMKQANSRRLNVRYIHVNCRELRGSLFMILRRIVQSLRPQFPERGYAASELLETLIQILDEENIQLLLGLDEIDSLIEKEGSEALYYLTRVQERRPEEERRLSLLVISRDVEIFRRLDRSTLSSLQRNVIRMSSYSQGELSDIVRSRAERAFKENAISLEIIEFISELASMERGDARYAIDLLWRSGKYADVSYSNNIQLEHVRKAAATLFPVLRESTVKQLSLHEQLVLLGIGRFFLRNEVAKATTGEIETSYHIVCEEYGEKPRGHTQLWKYMNNLKNLDAIDIKLSSTSRGRTHLISLSKIPAEELEREVIRIIDQE
jgi:cell division control protein 6